MIYTKAKFILRTTQNLSCVLSVKSRVETQPNVSFLTFYDSKNRHLEFYIYVHE